MEFGLSFLGINGQQMPSVSPEGPAGVEAVIFDRKHLEANPWDELWKNIAVAANAYGSDGVTFHFPVNDSDYVEDPFVMSRLCEAYARATDLGLRGIVVHANRIRPIHIWQGMNLKDEQQKVIGKLVDVAEKIPSSGTWIALENMPVMDNDGDLIDPSFVFPSDFEVLKGTRIRVIWDVNHYFNSILTLREVFDGRQPAEDYPNLQHGDFFDFKHLGSRIAHWHFSSFLGVPDRRRNKRCVEGVLPWEGTLPEDYFSSALKMMASTSPSARCVFEVQELDYTQRVRGPKIIEWSREVLDRASMKTGMAYAGI
jgi:hypothetical protein